MEKPSNPIERFLKLRQVFEQTKNQKELDTLARICFHFDGNIFHRRTLSRFAYLGGGLSMKAGTYCLPRVGRSPPAM